MERAAGIDLGELARVADQDDLRSCDRCMFDEPGELACANHRGFIDDEHRGGVEAVAVGTFDLAEQAVDGPRGDAGVVL